MVDGPTRRGMLSPDAKHRDSTVSAHSTHPTARPSFALLLVALLFGCGAGKTRVASPPSGDALRAEVLRASPTAALRSVEQAIVPPGDDMSPGIGLWLARAGEAGDSPRLMAAAGAWGIAEQPEGGRALVDRALTAAPDDPVVQRFAGESWLRRISTHPIAEQKVRAEKAARHFRRTLLTAPDAAAAGYGLARALAIIAPDHPDIRPILERAYRARPDAPPITLALARRRLDDGDTAAATAALDTLGEALSPWADVTAKHLRRQIEVAVAAPPSAEACPADGRRLQLVVLPQGHVARPCVDAEGHTPTPPLRVPDDPLAKMGFCKKDDIPAVMADIAPRVTACYSDLLRRQRVEGRLDSAFRIGQGGRLLFVEIREVDPLAPLAPIADCVADALRATPWMPPRPEGLCQVDYPFVFEDLPR